MFYFQKILNKLLIFLIKPFKIYQANKLNISEHKNYSNSFIFIDKLNEKSVAIDIGCAEDADLSKLLINKYNLKCYGIDPTKKHSEELLKLQNSSNNLFEYHQYAITTKDECLTFYESNINQSGSLISNHINVTNNNITKYKVQGMSLPSLFKKLDLEKIDLLKLDIEGAEYNLLDAININDLDKVDQIFIEFHHHAIPEFSQLDTKKSVKRISSFGFKYFTFDYHNYLFFK